MAIPTSMKPKPYTLRRGETIPKVLRSRGFGPGDVDPIMRLRENKGLIKKFGSVDDVPAGETVYIPAFSQDQARSLWDGASAIGSVAGSVRENILAKALRDARRDVSKLRQDISKVWDILGPDAQNLRRAKDKCVDQLPRGMNHKELDDCVVAIEKYLCGSALIARWPTRQASWTVTLPMPNSILPCWKATCSPA